MVAHICNPNYSIDGNLEDHSSRPAQAKKFPDSISTSSSHLIQLASINKRIVVQVYRGKKKKGDPFLKITNSKRTGCIAQVVQYLPSKYKVLSSNPRITHPIKKKKFYSKDKGFTLWYIKLIIK
jgi:hypothetical protein